MYEARTLQYIFTMHYFSDLYRMAAFQSIDRKADCSQKNLLCLWPEPTCLRSQTLAFIVLLLVYFQLGLLHARL